MLEQGSSLGKKKLGNKVQVEMKEYPLTLWATELNLLRLLPGPDLRNELKLNL